MLSTPMVQLYSLKPPPVLSYPIHPPPTQSSTEGMGGPQSSLTLFNTESRGGGLEMIFPDPLSYCVMCPPLPPPPPIPLCTSPMKGPIITGPSYHLVPRGKAAEVQKGHSSTQCSNPPCPLSPSHPLVGLSRLGRHSPLPPILSLVCVRCWCFLVP